MVVDYRGGKIWKRSDLKGFCYRWVLFRIVSGGTKLTSSLDNSDLEA